MASRKFSKTVTVSLVALAAATGAAVLEAGAAAAAPAVETDAVSTTPANKVFTEFPGLKQLLKVANQAPAVNKVAIKVAHKISDFYFPHQVDGQSPQ